MGVLEKGQLQEQPCKQHSCIVLVSLYVHVFSSILQLALIAVKRRARRKEKQMRFVHKESKGLRSEATMKASLLPVFASVSGSMRPLSTQRQRLDAPGCSPPETPVQRSTQSL